MTLSTRLNPTFGERVKRAADGIGVSPSDLVREGLSRVVSEVEAAGTLRLGVAVRKPVKAPTRKPRALSKAS